MQGGSARTCTPRFGAAAANDDYSDVHVPLTFAVASEGPGDHSGVSGHPTAMSGPAADGLYVLVVVDHRLRSIETYGPLTAATAAQALVDLRRLLITDGLDQVSVTTARLHRPGRADHLDDP